jgi:hypothetical protein
MSQSLSKLVSRRMLLAVLALTLLFANFALTPAEAAAKGCMGTGTSVTYYSDASLTNQVGHYLTNCQGVCSGSGRVTDYYTVAYLPCAPPPGGGEA